MEDKEKVIVKQAVLKATALLVPSVKLDNATPTDVSKVTIQIAQDLFDWVFKDVGTVKDVGTGAAQNTKVEKQDDRPGFEPKCPVCDSFVWDNRETATSQQPKWRCKNEDCTGGSFSKKYNRLMACYHLHVDKDLGPMKEAVRRIPCNCRTCYEKLKMRWIPNTAPKD